MSKLFLALVLVACLLPAQSFDWSRGLPRHASAPATCDAHEVYFNTTSSTAWFCSATDTWTQLSAGGGGSPVDIDVNAQTGTTYTVQAGDKGKNVTHSNAAAIAVTLPQATGSFGDGWWYYTKNLGAGIVTITPTTSTLAGASKLLLHRGKHGLIVSDGTNYHFYGQRETVFNVKSDCGALGDMSNDDTAEIQACIDAAEAAGIANRNGGVVFFPPGEYMISDPLVLPRSGATPDGWVRVRGAGVAFTNIRGTGSWASGEALIEWEAVDARAWYNEISNLKLWPPPVDGTMAVHYEPTDKTDEESTFGEYLVIHMENVDIYVDNQYHEVAIWLEGNVRNSTFRDIGMDPGLANRVYDTLLFRFSEAVADNAPAWGDVRGVNYSTFERIYAGERRGGYSRVFEGRFGGVTANTVTCNGGYESASFCYQFIESTNSTFTNIFLEGYGETQIRLEDCENLTFNNIILGTPNDQGDGVNDGLELIDSSRNLFISRPSRAGQASFNASGVKAIVLDADSDQNTFLKWQLADEFANEVTDAGDDNYFEFFLRDVPGEEVVGVHPYHRQATAVLTNATSTPASAGAACVTGTFSFDASFLYICIATNTWERAAIASW